MLSDNIKYYRKKNNLSQEELAEKIGVSRQSVSFWETGQTQPTIDNIIALSKIFHITADELLGNTDTADGMLPPASDHRSSEKVTKITIIIASVILCMLIIATVIFTALFIHEGSRQESTGTGKKESITTAPLPGTTTIAPDVTNEPLDLFLYCKNFAIQKGILNGDYCIYQQPATQYGGYENEYFSISYWADTDVVEFCLHCPLDETTSHNFYLRMRGGYNHKYEYVSSKYYRDTGESFREARGYIDPAVFSASYPISCDTYIGTTDGQTEFMEQSRIGICDLIACLKRFVEVENMECAFSDFEFVNFLSN